MATTAQLTKDLINAVAKIRMGDGSPMQIKFSDGKTRTIYNDGSGSEDILGLAFRNMGSQFDAATAALKPPAPAPAPKPAPTPTPIAQVAPTPAPKPAAQPAAQPAATPVAQVAPQSASVPFALQGGNAAFFPNLDPKTGLPIIKQSVIDAELNKTKSNVLTANNSNIRDAIYGSGWNAKSDAVQVLKGAAVYGLNKAPVGMGGLQYQSPEGKALTDADFINAAKAAGIDPNQYYSKQNVGPMGAPVNALNKDALYNAINDKAKNLYSITNTIEAGARGTKTPHATILFSSDGQGNLVPQTNAQTGQPAVQYANVTRYAEAPGFLEEFGPLLGMAGLAFGAPYLSNLMGGTTAALGAGQVGAMGAGTAGAGLAGMGAGAGLGTGTMAGTMLGTTGATLGTTAGIASGLGAAGLLGGGTAAGLPLNQVGALTSTMTPAQVAALPTTGDVLAGGALANGIGMGAGSAAAGTALAKAFENNALYNLLGSGAGALASYLGASGQADAAREAAENQMSMFNTINKQLQPQRGAGYQALNQIRSMLPGQSMAYDELGNPVGVQTGTDYLTRQFTPQDLQAGLAPNYQFMLGQGQQQAQRQANLSGGAVGGNALRALQDYTQNYAGNAYQNAFQNFNTQRTGIYNTLAGIAGIGQNATNTSANAGQAATTAAGQLGVGSAAAQAAGLQGVANATSGGLQNYQQNQILQAILGQNQNVAQYQNTASSFPNVA
jgi:hypothetical protein